MEKRVQETWLHLDGLHIHCLNAGESGTPVILLHGAGLDSAMLSWEEIIEPLAEKHRVFAPDLAGYGLSDRPDISYTLDFYTNFVEHLLDILHLEKASLIGLSMGGSIALSLALQSPERVERLILVDSYGIQDRVSAHFFSYLFVHLPFVNEWSYKILGSSRSLIRWTLLTSLIYNPQHLSNELIEKVYQAAQEAEAGRAFISLQKNDVRWNSLRSNFINRLYEIQNPTLIIHGEQDKAVPLRYAQQAHQLIKGSQLAVMQNCRHWPQREEPKEFLQIVTNFLAN
jgi:pimeloyl-ACP methyl ester carboxylesterase